MASTLGLKVLCFKSQVVGMFVFFGGGEGHFAAASEEMAALGLESRFSECGRWVPQKKVT